MKWISDGLSMRRADAYASKELKIPSLLLMEAAARSVTEFLLPKLQEKDTVLVLAGVGGNGGDGFAIARMLKAKGFQVRVFFTGERSQLSGDAKTNFEMLPSFQIPVLSMNSSFYHIAAESEWVVDALFGSGLDRDVVGYLAQIITSVNDLHREGRFKVLSVDIPSGADSTTGKVLGCAIEADETVTFCRLKPGLRLFPGRDKAGKVTIADIGIPETIPPLLEAKEFMLENKDLKNLVPPRKSRSHKGLYGRLFIAAGCKSMTGAAVLTSAAAYKVGSGLVEVAIPSCVSSVLLSKLPEAVTTPYDDDEANDFAFVDKKVEAASAVLCGPGMSQAPYAKKLLTRILKTVPEDTVLVLDADALNMIAGDAGLEALVKNRGGNTVLTPHMGEASRLLDKPIADLMDDPIRYGKEMTERFNSIVVLKDALTLVFEPGGKIYYNCTGNNGMSTAGSGDVLAGMIAGLAGQGMEAFEAAFTGVYMHGLAGDEAAEKKGRYALMASDIVDHIHVDKLLEA